MIAWQSPEVLAFTWYLFAQLTAFSLGCYIWYFTLSLHKVELGLVRCRVRFQLAHVPYLTARYAQLVSLIAVAAADSMKMSPLAGCAGLGPYISVMRLVAVTNNLALAASSGNLVLRAMMLWKDKRSVSWILRGLCAGHLTYAVVLGIAGVRDGWDPILHKCILDVNAPRTPLVMFYVLTILWDVLILALTMLGMRRNELLAGLPLWSTLVKQGIGYVVVTLLTCIPMAIMYFINLNDAMNIFLIPPGGTISVIASSSAASSLLNMKKASRKSMTFAFRRARRHARTGNNGSGNVFTTVIDLGESRTSSQIDDSSSMPSSSMKAGMSSDIELRGVPSDR